MDLKNFVGNFFGFNQTISALQQDNLKLTYSIDDLTLQVKKALESDLTKTAKLESLQNTINTFNKEKEFENFITSKIPKTERYYSRTETDGEYSVDVRDFFMIEDKKIPIVQGINNDAKALEALRWVRKNVVYTPDSSTSTYKQDEYWAYCYQTLFHKKGDCEDGAILIANIMVRSGIPYYRVRVCAGSVNGGGHAYCVYCRETDNEWVVLDWCYWANDLPVAQRPTHKEMRNYFDKEKNFYVWFSWDLKNIYAKEELSTEAKGYFK